MGCYGAGMRAMTYTSYGDGEPAKLTLVDVPPPMPGAGQVLVRVVCSSVNPIDWKRSTGAMKMILPACFPLTPGYDIAGEVAAVGEGVTELAVGQRVHARIGEHAGGAAAELAVAGVDVTVAIPEGMTHAEAAGLPLAGMTALQGLRDQTELLLEGSKDRVLIVGASGGVGHVGVQIARAAGATVVGVCSARNRDLVLSLGAQSTIDYAAKDPYAGQAPFDVILDCVGSEAGPWLPLLGPGGRYASCLPRAGVFLRSAINIFTEKKVRPVLLKSRAADLAILDEMFAKKQLRVVVDSHFRLEDLAAAWERSRTGRAVGKIIVDVSV